MEASQDAVRVIMHYEDLRLRAYLDAVGVPTIGFGHTKGVYLGQTITQVEAKALLKQDMKEAEDFLNDHVKVPLKQQEFDALVSWVFNIGRGAASTSTLMRVLNLGNKDLAAENILKWTWGTVKGKRQVLNGLTKRRLSERHLFLTGEVRFY